MNTINTPADYKGVLGVCCFQLGSHKPVGDYKNN
jgi:hypothetical protein